MSVVLPASGCEMMAKVRLRSISGFTFSIYYLTIYDLQFTICNLLNHSRFNDIKSTERGQLQSYILFRNLYIRQPADALTQAVFPVGDFDAVSLLDLGLIEHAIMRSDCGGGIF